MILGVRYGAARYGSVRFEVWGLDGLDLLRV